MRAPNAFALPNGQFCRRNLRRAPLYEFPCRAVVSRSPRHRIAPMATRAGAQLIMLRRRPKTVESYREATPNRDNPHFGGA
ncbi:hypothetical protein EJ998_39950 (plasmid) [Burkholderia cepacia ATCC 25416]|nr:hypothetical protein EJ998_39950 [Burkholderia cepacia ATCC 25416]